MSIELVGKDAPRMLNKLAREQMKERLMRDILADMTVCELEGWDRVEYLNELKELIDSFIDPRNTRKGENT